MEKSKMDENAKGNIFPQSQHYIQGECSFSPVVVKANELIQQSRFNMSVVEQRLVLLIISKLRRDDDSGYCEISVTEFSAIADIDGTSGQNYARIKKAIKNIADVSVWIRLENGSETLVRWIEKPYIEPQSGKIRIRLDKDMRPFLLQLKDNFTRYELFWILKLKSKYSIRLYELLKSVYYHEETPYSVSFELEALKERLSAQMYKEYSNFRHRCLETAIQEINAHTDLVVKYFPTYSGRKVIGITFEMEKRRWGKRHL